MFDDQQSFTGSDGTTMYLSGPYHYVLLEDGTAQIVGHDYFWDSTVIQLPEMLDHRVVTSIAGGLYGLINDDAHTVIIPNSITRLPGNPFREFQSLKTIMVAEDHPTLEVINGVLYTKQTHSLLCYPCGLKDRCFTVPEGTRSLSPGAFSSYEGLGMQVEEVILPRGLTDIGDEAFWGCNLLTAVTLPSSVMFIGKNAFPRRNDGRCPVAFTVMPGSFAEEYCRRNHLLIANGD